MALPTLTSENVKQLIAGGESLTVEFKSERRDRLSDQEVFETIVCLANGDGGVLILGVEDNGTITGARKRHDNSTDPQLLTATIFNNTVPPINTRVSLHQLGTKEVIAIEVDRYPTVCATRSGKILRRVAGVTGPECQPMYPNEFVSRHSDLGVIDYSAQLVQRASWEDLDPLEIERLRQTIGNLRGDQALVGLNDHELIQALGLVETVHQDLIPNVAGMLLVGRESRIRRFLPTAQFAFQVLDGSHNVLVNDWFHGPLVRTLQVVTERFDARNDEEEIPVGPYRLPIPDYDPDSFREALSNAMIHRDYSRLGAVHVQLYPDHLSIANPGGFLEGITLDNLLVHEPKPRNPCLANAFRRLGLVETTGRGIDRIFMGQLRLGRPLPNYAKSDPTAVRLELRSGDASLEFAALVFEEAEAGHRLSLPELIALTRTLDVRQVTAAEIARAIQRDEAFARSLMERLVERGWFEARGRRPNRAYQLSAPLYERLGAKAAYVRMRGYDTIQQESMILEFVRVNSKISRSDVIELCGLEPRQASYLLTKLVKKGRLRKQGQRRWTHYVAVEADNESS